MPFKLQFTRSLGTANANRQVKLRKLSADKVAGASNNCGYTKITPRSSFVRWNLDCLRIVRVLCMLLQSTNKHLIWILCFIKGSAAIISNNFYWKRCKQMGGSISYCNFPHGARYDFETHILFLRSPRTLIFNTVCYTCTNVEYKVGTQFSLAITCR